jgi:Uma2 family endonuclease
MTTITKHNMTVEEFLAWAEGKKGRFELWNGEPYAMAPERVAHAETKFSAALAFNTALNALRLPCRILLDGVAVRIDARSTYQPDIIVYCGERLPPNEREVQNPIIVIEVLSPSTKAIDMRLKLKRYFELPSVLHYVILDADERSIIHYSKGKGDVIAMRIASEGELRFDPPGFAVDVRSLFPEPYRAA